MKTKDRAGRQIEEDGGTSRSRGEKEGEPLKKTKRTGDARAAARMGLAQQPVPD